MPNINTREKRSPLSTEAVFSDQGLVGIIVTHTQDTALISTDSDSSAGEEKGTD